MIHWRKTEIETSENISVERYKLNKESIHDFVSSSKKCMNQSFLSSSRSANFQKSFILRACCTLLKEKGDKRFLRSSDS